MKGLYMARIFDIQLNDNKELVITADGDFSINESTTQHQECLLIASPGSYLGSASTGVDLPGHINNDESAESIKKSIQQQFEADGMIITRLSLKNGNIDVKAEYNG